MASELKDSSRRNGMCDSCEIRGLLFIYCVKAKLLAGEPDLGLWDVVSLM